MNEEDRKIEASISVQARVNIVALAQLVKYWEGAGYEIRTISQLVGWSIDLLYEVLKSNEKIDRGEFSVADADRYLVSRRLYQRSMREKDRGKIATAIRFEGIREDGGNPRDVDPRSYNILHNERSITLSGERVLDKRTRDAVEIYNKMSKEELDIKAKELMRRDEEERIALDEFLSAIDK